MKDHAKLVRPEAITRGSAATLHSSQSLNMMKSYAKVFQSETVFVTMSILCNFSRDYHKRLHYFPNIYMNALVNV